MCSTACVTSIGYRYYDMVLSLFGTTFGYGSEWTMGDTVVPFNQFTFVERDEDYLHSYE